MTRKKTAADIATIEPEKPVIPQPQRIASSGKGMVATGNFEDVYQYIWENTDLRGGICGLFQLNCASPHLWHWHSLVRQQPLTVNLDGRCVYFAVLQIDDDSVYRTMVNKGLIPDRVDRPREIIEGLAAGGLVKAWRTREFPELGLTVTIYRRTSSHLDPGWRD